MLSLDVLTLPLSFSGAVEFSKLDCRVDQKKIVLKALVRWLRAFWEISSISESWLLVRMSSTALVAKVQLDSIVSQVKMTMN